MKTDEKIFKSAEIAPEIIQAGDSDEFIIRLVIGKAYTEHDSRIIFDFSSTLGTSCPTRQVNESSGYIETYVNNPRVEYNTRVWDLDHKHFVGKEHRQSREAARMVVLDLSSGLKAGDTVELHWGETTGGFGPGAKVSSIVPRPGYRARIDVRYFASQDKGMPDNGRDYEGYTRPVPDHIIRLEYKIEPRELKRLRLIRKPDQAMLIPYDRFWNIAKVSGTDFEADAQCEINRHGTLKFANKNVNVISNKTPLTANACMNEVYEGNNIYWGDVHTHSSYSNDCFQRSAMDMTPGDLMDFARFRSGLDFFAVTDHHQPWDKPANHIGELHWEQTLEDIKAKSINNEFIVFPGLEFRCPRGDTAVIFNGFPSYEAITNVKISDIRKVWELIKDCDLITIPHFHNGGSLSDDEWYYPTDSRFEPVIEIYSDHGSYEREQVLENGRAWCKQFRKDRCAEHFLNAGYKYGFGANSDDHKGHVGVNGITAIYAKELTRDAIFAAYRQRNVYGTTNARIRLLFTANDQLMGSCIKNTDAKEFLIDVIGENFLKKVEIFKDGNLFKMFEPEGKAFKTELKFNDSAISNWYVRVTQQDNHIAWSSPIWFE
ncbi:MAG: DUF3604 domain-containing protein [Victivallaceae bacterium]|nr:DUF3604 domain-containing protein [Victivallaceae bacterium]